MEDSEIQEICDQIYEKHKRALDILFEHRPDRTMVVKSILELMVRERDDLTVDHCTKSGVSGLTWRGHGVLLRTVHGNPAGHPWNWM